MRAVTFQAPEQVRVEDKPEPELAAPDDVIVDVESSGVCGSDLHIYHGRVPVEQGFTIGHEFVGTVLAAGEGVDRVAVGDRVVGCFHTACATCDPCLRGDYHRCANGQTFGHGSHLGNLQGAQAERLLVPRSNLTLRRVPDSITSDVALFAGDVMATGFHAIAHGGMREGDTVAVLGLGPVGLCAVQSAIAGGAGQVFAIDTIEERLAMARGVRGDSDPPDRGRSQGRGPGRHRGRRRRPRRRRGRQPGAAGAGDQPGARRRHGFRDRRLRRPGGDPTRARLAQEPRSCGSASPT